MGLRLARPKRPRTAACAQVEPRDRFRAMHLETHGHPLHSRALAVTLRQRADAKVDVAGYVLDLRKRGFVPVAGDLQGIGIIHHMRLEGVVDPRTGILETIAAEQLNVAFEPSEVTRGESCRDPIAAVAAMAGTRLDAEFSKSVGAAIGGPRGCSHLVTLAHLLGSTVAWAIEREDRRYGGKARPAGDRIFRRDVIIDGHETAERNGTMTLALQLADLHFAPASRVVRPMDRYGADHEIRGLMTIEFPTFALRDCELAERRREAASFTEAEWLDRGDLVDELKGLRFGFGVTGELLRRFREGRPDDRPTLDSLLMVAPALIQCSAALSDSWPAAFKQDASIVGMGGLPDSCYMWRRDGVLSRAREAEGGKLPVPAEVARTISRRTKADG
jgi:hypothetical protein